MSKQCGTAASGQGGGCGEIVVYRCAMSKQSGHTMLDTQSDACVGSSPIAFSLYSAMPSRRAVHYAQSVRRRVQGDGGNGVQVHYEQTGSSGHTTPGSEGSLHGRFSWAPSGGLNGGFTSEFFYP